MNQAQMKLVPEENFGPDYQRMHFVDKGGFGNEIYTIRVGTKWLDADLVGKTLDTYAGPTKAEADSMGVYIVQSVAAMTLNNVPAAVYRKLVGRCKGSSLITFEHLKTCYGEGVNSETLVTVLHLTKFKA